MNPAPSVIIFTVLSGLGFGFLAWLCSGIATPDGLHGLLVFALGYGLAVGGLVASTFHLGQPMRAWRAFTQWRSSWLSREAWVSVAALLAAAPVALGALAGREPGLWGLVAAALCLGTVLCTAMIYAQLATVPRWHHPLVPVTFVLFALAGGAILLPLPGVAAVLSAGLAAMLAIGFRIGDGRFAGAGSTLATATGLGGIGAPRVFEQPHTGGNYLTREMIHVVGRRHAARLRSIAVAGVALPALILPLLPPVAGVALALCAHLAGAFAARWLFFAEAEHVVGLYYGRRPLPEKG
ncbi:MAG: dimethyl sulfoxide reductase anchor subunit [Rhodobacter sp.]|nr:dimethyl sulfoxide reductase anchor subunit [Rhodobacter sp.]